MKDHTYVIGKTPYDSLKGDYHTRGNGEWYAKAHNIEEALRIIFGSMPFPGEPTGRKVFIEGMSLSGVHEDEVIQVWSTEPEVVERSRKAIPSHRSGGLHDGRGKDLGLHVEIRVTDIEKYLTPAKALLAAPLEATPGSTNTAISPMGASLLKLDEMKHDLDAAMQGEEMNLTRRQWEMEALQEDLATKRKSLQQQINVLNTYLHGTRYITRLCTGKHGSGKYHVFQNRQFLSEEVALLGNFVDFDFSKLEDLEKWLLKSDRIWKFLPFERCILATRIRQERKHYHDPICDIVNNMENMRNMIWIRDGENVTRVDVEFDFHNAVFPDKNQAERSFHICRNYLWQKAFKWKKQTNWHGEELKPGDYDEMGKMRRKPLNEEEPYYTVTNVLQRFHTLEDWLNSEFYNETLEKQLRDAVHDYLRGVNKRQMVFAVLLQGIVDNTNLLDVPKGTDLFNWESLDKYFTLVFDYSHAITWQGVSDKVDAFTNGKVAVGDWIVAEVDEYIPAPPERRWASGTKYKESRPALFQVIELREAESMKYDGDEKKKVTELKPVVNYHPVKSRRSSGEDYWAKNRTKAPVKLHLKNSYFMRVPMPPSLAKQVLEDRNWKLKNKQFVPWMVNYRHIIAAVKKAQNQTIIKWDDYDD